MGMPLKDRETHVLVMDTLPPCNVHTVDEAVTARAWLLMGPPLQGRWQRPQVEAPGNVACSGSSKCPCELQSLGLWSLLGGVSLETLGSLPL